MEQVNLTHADAPSSADISKSVNFSPEALKPFGFRANSKELSTMSEEFRAIKREVLTELTAPEPEERLRNRIMVTSIHEGEGKTFTALNLARSVSLEQDKHVLLVDTNVLSPSIGGLVTPQPDVGLIDYLTDNALPIVDVIHQTDIDRLRILPMGHQHHLANELLSGPSMKTLMGEFNSRYDDRIVIFDAPPLLGVNETMTMTNHVDQIILVLQDEHVKVKDLKRIQRLLPAGIKVHYVLNKTLSDRNWRRTENQNEEYLESATTGSHPWL